MPGPAAARRWLPSTSFTTWIQGIFPRYLKWILRILWSKNIQVIPHIPARWVLEPMSLNANHLRLVGVLETAFLGMYRLY